MRRIAPGLLVVFFAAAAAADDKPRPRASPAERLAAVQKELKDAEAAYYKAAEPLPDTPEGSKKAGELWQAFDKKQADLFMQAVELAREGPKSDVGFAALEWVLTNPRGYFLPAGKPALELLTERPSLDRTVTEGPPVVELCTPLGPAVTVLETEPSGLRTRPSAPTTRQG